ncbi:MAG: lysis protein [Gammaproteobacteria bacterium]|nr:lysis protein [Gammaproteobacteria bacterium]
MMITDNIKRGLIAAVIAVVVVLSVATVMLYKKTVATQADNAELRLTISSQQTMITTMTEQQQAVTALDANHIKELTNAKSKISELERAVTANNQRLLVRARCPVSSSATAASVDNAAAAELAAAARSDYFRLRESIVTVTEQVVTLQDYINTVCLKQPGK